MKESLYVFLKHVLNESLEEFHEESVNLWNSRVIISRASRIYIKIYNNAKKENRYFIYCLHKKETLETLVYLCSRINIIIIIFFS